jgi:undecaprenyl-diphosphatase
MQEILKAIVLGVIQGLTEYLPISSTAHLRIIPSLFGWHDIGAAYTAVIQLGTMVALILYFRTDIIRILVSFVKAFRSKDWMKNNDSRLLLQILAGSVPIVILGYLFKGFIRNEFRNIYFISVAIIFFSLVIYVSERWAKQILTMDKLVFKDAVLIGFFQSLALIPGASRSGITIAGGFFRDLKRADAARFSFLLSIPAVLLSGVYELYSERALLFNYQSGVLSLILATVVSGVVGYLSIWFMLTYLKTHTLGIFILYRVIFAIAVLMLLYFNIISN